MKLLGMLLLHCCRELIYDAKFMVFAMLSWWACFNEFWSCTLLRVLSLFESSIFVLFLITLGVAILGSYINIEPDATTKLSQTNYTVISCWKSAYIFLFILANWICSIWFPSLKSWESGTWGPLLSGCLLASTSV